MAISNQFLKAAAVCTDILRRYHVRERTAASKELMVAEVETLLGWLKQLDLPSEVNRHGFLAPVREHLLARYGSKAGGRIFAELIEVLEAAGTSSVLVTDQSQSADGIRTPGFRGWHPSIDLSELRQ